MVGSWISMNREGTKTLKLDLFYRKIDILTLWSWIEKRKISGSETNEEVISIAYIRENKDWNQWRAMCLLLRKVSFW